ncbi:MAG TPA: hypothetical protein VF484_10625, partial [Candidatus Limnocylindrales bacterium]
MLARLGRAIVPVGSGLVALVLSHSIVYLVRYGSAYGEALAHNGHDAAWTIAVWSSGSVGAALALAGFARLLVLGRATGESWPLGATDRGELATRAAIGAWLRSWLVAGLRLGVATAVLLTIQENAEHLAAGLPLQGVGLLISEEYPFALAIVVAVSLAVSLVVALYRRRRDELLARLRRARSVYAVARPLGGPVRTQL